MTRSRGPATPKAFVPPVDAGPPPPSVEPSQYGGIGDRETGFAAIDRDALLSFLRENLRVSISYEVDDYEGASLTIELLLDGEVISRDKAR